MRLRPSVELCATLLSGECSSLEKQLADVSASEAALTKANSSLEAKLAELEELMASTTAMRDELQGENGTL